MIASELVAHASGVRTGALRLVAVGASGIAVANTSAFGGVTVARWGLVYTIGLGAVVIILPAALINSMGAWVMAKRLRLRAEVREMITIPDAIAARLDSRVAQRLAGLAIVPAVVGYMATNLLALGPVIDAIFRVNHGAAIWIGTVVALAYAASGGILGLFALTRVPSLAIGLKWQGATRAGAVCSIATGLITTLTLESLAFFKVFASPVGVTATAIALVASLLVLFGVSWLTRHTAAATLAADVRAVMEA